MFFAATAFGHFLAGPIVDYFRSDEVGSLTITWNGRDVYYSTYRLIFIFGAFFSFLSFLICTIFYEEIDQEAAEFRFGETNLLLEG